MATVDVKVKIGNLPAGKAAYGAIPTLTGTGVRQMPDIAVTWGPVTTPAKWERLQARVLQPLLALMPTSPADAPLSVAIVLPRKKKATLTIPCYLMSVTPVIGLLQVHVTATLRPCGVGQFR